jgi:hypothetical protein
MDPRASSGYTPAPRMVLPPAGWAPQRIVLTAPPRELPHQDHAGIDEAERRATLVTRAVGLVAAAVLAVLLLVLVNQQAG